MPISEFLPLLTVVLAVMDSIATWITLAWLIRKSKEAPQAATQKVKQPAPKKAKKRNKKRNKKPRPSTK